MKHFYFSVICFLAIAISAFSQVPDAFNYQAVVRNSSGEIIASQAVSFRISILQNTDSGTSVYVETQNVATNSFGLANLKIGKGSRVSGVFDPGGWGAAPHFIKVEMDPSGGSSYELLGTSQLLSVPYAFHAQTVQEDKVDDADADPANEIQSLNLSGTNLSLSKGGGTVTLPSSGGGDNWGTQTVVSDATLSGNGTTANPLSVNGDLTDNQTLSISGNDLSISDGNTVTLPSGGESLWTARGDDIYRSNGLVGIGTSSPDNNLEIFNPTGNATARLKSGNWGASLVIARNGASYGAFTNYYTSSGTDFYTGMLNSANFKISADFSTLKGLEINTTGDVFLSNDLHMQMGSSMGIGVTIPFYALEIKNNDFAGLKFTTPNAGILKADGFLIGLNNSNNIATISNLEYGPIEFSTNNSKRMSISETGKLVIGEGNAASMVTLQAGNSLPGIQFLNYKFGTTIYDGLLIGYNDYAAYLHFYENYPLQFGTNNLTRMTIAANGYLGIGTTSPAAGLHLKGTGYPSAFMYLEASSGQDAGFRLYEGSTAKWHIFNNSAAGGLQIYNTGTTTAIFCKQSNSYVGIGTTAPTQALHVVGNAYKTEGGNTWATSSDIRLKNVLGNYSKGLTEITALQPVRYIYKKDNARQLNSTEIQVGFVAQEVQKIFPEAVTEGEDGFLDFNIHPINIAFVNAIKELKSENEQLKTENEQLKAKFDNLESRLESMELIVKASASKQF